MSSKIFFTFGLLVFFMTVFADGDSSPILNRYPRHLQKRASNASLPKDKYDAILKIYSAPGEMADKDKKAAEVSQNYSSTEKQIVERIKTFFHKRADILKKFPSSTIDTLKTIRELRKKQKEAFNTIPKDQQKDASFIIFGVAPHDLNSPDHPEQKGA